MEVKRLEEEEARLLSEKEAQARRIEEERLVREAAMEEAERAQARAKEIEDAKDLAEAKRSLKSEKKGVAYWQDKAMFKWLVVWRDEIQIYKRQLVVCMKAARVMLQL